MIHWLIQTTEDVPQDFGWLGAAELERCSALKTEKRRADWLLGRWTAKNLVQSVVGTALPLEAISIIKRADGSPAIYLGQQPMFSVSISHSRGVGFCALTKGGRLGADIEAVEPRIPVFIEDYFAAPEQMLVERAADRDLLVTAIWSAKEAVLKAQRLGLTVDTRTVLCLIEAGQGLDWTSFPVEASAGQFSGWWRRLDHFVLTLVSEGEQPEGQQKGIFS
jgi:4'-phosphopantetheinyl transferase